MKNPQFSSGEELPESRLYTFIDEAREFAIYFLEGQKLIHDLVLLHEMPGQGFAWFRDVVLSIQPMIALLKQGEQLGFYLDGESPTFRLKIETGHNGMTRSVMYPEAMQEFPKTMTGLVRMQKLFPHNKAPYESVLRVHDQPLDALVNTVLRDSYQVNSTVIVSQVSDQSVLLHQLPPLSRGDEYELSEKALLSQREELSERLAKLFEEGWTDPADIEAAFKEVGFRLLISRGVLFRCSCSRERLISSLHGIYTADRTTLFDPDQESIEVNCEYCKTAYVIARSDLETATDALN